VRDLVDVLFSETFFYVYFALLAAVAAYYFYRDTWLRRKDMQAFAAGHGFRYEGTLAPDGRPPYDRFDHLKWSVLIYDTIAGTWDGLDVTAFDMKPSKHTTCTAAIVCAPDILGDGTTGPGPHEPFAEVTTAGELLYVRARRQLPVSALPGFLADAVAMARARCTSTTSARGLGVPTFRQID
jgi:hypothetical protein